MSHDMDIMSHDMMSKPGIWKVVQISTVASCKYVHLKLFAG